MKRSITVMLFTLVAAAPAAYAQSDLNETQAKGRQLLAQSCGICHLPPSMGAKTYGPTLNRGTVGGSDEAMRAIISMGTERMPAFRHYLNPSDIEAIIAYVKTIPAPGVKAAANEQQRGESR